MGYNGYCFDIEADGLYLPSKKIWYIKFLSLDKTKEMKLYPFRESKESCVQKIVEWNNQFEDGCFVVGHNILGYDNWMVWRHLGIKIRVGKRSKDWFGDKHVQFYDSFVVSQYLKPDLPFHSLEYLSRGSENEKMEYREELIKLGLMEKSDPKGHEFSFWNEVMPKYCDDDVLANIGVFEKQWKFAKELYADSWYSNRMIHSSLRQMQKDYWLYSAQAYSGSPFHKERAEALASHIEIEMKKIKDEVDPQLPPRPLKTAEQAFYKMPSKPYTKSGELSATMVKWLDKHNATLSVDGFIEAYGLKQKLVANDVLDVKLPMEIDDNAELKDYFIKSGWIPSDDFWNYKKGDDGKPLRDDKGKLTKTTPKINHAGQLCPNLLKLSGDIPTKVVKFLSYRNRLGVVRGWLSNWRLEFDGRISSEISGYTPTTRVKHKTIVNCPKADPKVLLGYEMRDLFIAPEGFWYVGADASALENRTLAAYTHKHDGGKFATLILEGDSHTFNAFAFFPEIESMFNMYEEGLKDKHEFKPYRNKAKTGAYLLAYGGGIPKLASSLNLPMKQAEIAYANYWKKNEGLGKLKEAAEKYYNSKGQKKYLPAWDGRILSIRSKNKIINCLGQSLGAICMSIAACIMDAKLGELYLDEMGRPYYLYKGKVVWRSNLTHDEYSFMTEDGIQDFIREESVKSIIEAGEYLKLPIALDGEGKMSYEGSWKDVH